MKGNSDYYNLILLAFLHDRREFAQRGGMIVAPDTKKYMPIGKQTGFFSKTISLLLKKYELLEKIAETSFPNACFNNFPVIKNLVHCKNKLYLPAWLFV